MSETEFFGFGDALVGAKSGANFSTEPDFTKDYKIFGEFAASDSGSDRETDGEVGSGILDTETADDVDKNIFIV